MGKVVGRKKKKPLAAQVEEETLAWVQAHALLLAWLIAVGGLALSLFFGEVMHLEPCRLCWYQRVAIFPLALFLGIAAYKKDWNLARYSLPLVAFGGIFALYQTISQYFPSTHIHALCGSAEQCTLPIFYLFGVVSFPLLSTIGFACIAILLLFSEKPESR
jgi:disulfide bond formation protein DsbB